MEIRFSWLKFNERYHPSCECINLRDQYDYLGCLLTDDGGLGLDHHIPWLRGGKKMCENVLNGRSSNECFTTELFSASISADGIWISDISADPTSGAKFRIDGFVQVLSNWIEFLEAGIQHGGAPIAIHVDL
jgi:hypothetical protein